MGINVKKMLEELGIRNQDVTKLVEAENKALESLTKAQERLEAARQAREQAEEQPDVMKAAMELVSGMEELELDEKVIRSAVRTKFGVKRTARSDDGSDLTDEVKNEMRALVDASGAEGFTTSALVEQFEVKRTQVAAWIKDLVEGAEVVKHGSKRGTKYYLADMAPVVDADADDAVAA